MQITGMEKKVLSNLTIVILPEKIEVLMKCKKLHRSVMVDKQIASSVNLSSLNVWAQYDS